jgi:hypothetical protein
MALKDLESKGLAKVTLKWWPRGKDHATPIIHTCNVPHKALNIDVSGTCYVCHCEAWLPIPVGNILDFNQLEDVWSSTVARELQADVDNQNFTYCAVKHCGITDFDINFPIFNIGINIDESCNLSCPSCRRQMVNHTDGPVFEERRSYINHIVKLINNFNQPMKLTMSGNGDPLASVIMRPLVLNWHPKDNQTIKLFTNGLLMKKLLPDSTVFKNIKEFQISVDAGSKEVYEIVRKPGKFSILRENLDWLAENIAPGVQVFIQFCLQATNVNDLVNFANMCQHYGFMGNVTKLDNWNTFNNFSEHDVIDNISHPLHNVAIKQLQLVKNHPNICLNSYLRNLINE